MKSALIVHGWDGRPDEAMLQWIQNELKKKGYEVVAPAMPNPGEPKIDVWVAKLQEVAPKEGERIFIGHSIGCQAILRYIETLNENERIDKVVLIAPWMKLDMDTIKEEGEEVIKIAQHWMETPINFAKIRNIVGEVVAIFSDNDPYVPLSQKDLFEKELGAKTIVEYNKGHFMESDGVREMETVVKNE